MSLVETLDYDPITRIETVFHASTDGNQYTIETKQDVTDIVEANKIFFNDVDERARYGEHMQRMASIPVGIWFDLERKGIADDPKKLKQWLDDKDNAAFRTRPGKLSR